MDSRESEKPPNADEADGKPSGVTGKIVKLLGSLAAIIAALALLLNNIGGLKEALGRLFSANPTPTSTIAPGTPVPAPTGKRLVDRSEGDPAWAAARAGNYEEALALYSQFAKEHPNEMWGYINRSKVYKKLGRNEEALAVLNHALLFQPAGFTLGAILELRADIYKQQGRVAEEKKDELKAQGLHNQGFSWDDLIKF